VIPQRVFNRIARNVTVTPDGCHLSNYSVGSHGYSQIGWVEGGQRTVTLGHRVAWIAAHGPIPARLTIDHVCRVRRCVNVAHLRLLSNVENATDNGQGRKTECPRGHPYDERNTYVNRRGHRLCRACARERRAG
jgi:hypothetical protein